MANNFIFVRLEYSGGSVPTGWAEYQTGETAVLPGNLNFSGNRRRVTGDMAAGAGSFANRLFFQSTVGTQTRISVMPPSGSNNASGVQLWNSATDLENAARFDLGIDNTQTFLSSAITGTGTYLPLNFYSAGAVRMRLNTDGSIEFPTAGTRIRGDFASGPGSFNNRVIFQGTGNSQTALTAIPSGTGNVTALQLFSSSDPENASRGNFNLVSSQELNISASKSGTGTYPPITFSTSDIERYRIDTAGVHYWGAFNSNVIQNKVNGMRYQPSAGVFIYEASNPVLSIGTNGSQLLNFWYNGLNAIGSITTNGTVTSYNTSSDYRLKDNVQPLDAGEATDRIMAYRPVTWTWKTDGSFGKGFIAHECQAVDPMTATGTKDQMEQVGNIVLADGTIAAEDVKEPEDVFTYGEDAEWQMTTERPVYQGLDDSKMIPDMIAMMQRMETRIRELEAQVAALTPS